jgi:Glucose / Sorbosone dehydrogenase
MAKGAFTANEHKWQLDGGNCTDHECGEIAYVCNPTVAPSSLDFYTSDVIPDWNGTFLMTTLKAGVIFQLILNEEGTALAQEPVELFCSENRYRDLAFDPDGRTIYVITASFGPAQNIEGGSTTQIWTTGSLIAFTNTIYISHIKKRYISFHAI